MSEANQLLTFTDAGKVVGVSHSTVSKWVEDGHLKAVRMPGSRRRRIRKATLLAFLESLESETFASSES